MTKSTCVTLLINNQAHQQTEDKILNNLFKYYKTLYTVRIRLVIMNHTWHSVPPSRSPVAPQLIGYGATAHLESGGFIRSRPHVLHPDIQFHFLPSQVIDHGRVASRVEAYQVCVATFRMYSNGSTLKRNVCLCLCILFCYDTVLLMFTLTLL